MAIDHFFLEKILEKFNFTPTECQEELFSELSKFIFSTDPEQFMVVSGYAGTGKTSAIAAFISALKFFKYNFVLLAPTGRAAKVLANYTKESSFTIHKQIYRQKSLTDPDARFLLDVNKNINTIFIVDEASLVSNDSYSNSIFGTGSLLDDLFTYVRSGVDNRLILVGDAAQLPPIGLDRSPALDLSYIGRYGNPIFVEMRSVVRQAKDSGILHNATILRGLIEDEDSSGIYPKFEIDQYSDVERVNGTDLIEKIGDCFDKYGVDNCAVLCRSNKRANRYNAGIRAKIMYKDEMLSRGDKLMVVKNCYQFLDDIEELDFIANGDVAELIKISKFEERYGLHFAQATLAFPDYNSVEIDAKVILDTLESESASLSAEQQEALFSGVLADYADITTKKKRYAAIREDKYYNALQIKYAAAMGCCFYR